LHNILGRFEFSAKRNHPLPMQRVITLKDLILGNSAQKVIEHRVAALLSPTSESKSITAWNKM
jgi:hypothetical protein